MFVSTTTKQKQTHTDMTNEQLNQLSDLLEEYLNNSQYEMGSDEDRAISKALDLVNEEI